MGLERPFIYISALMRTGSTLLSELLTLLPYSFIFFEPHMGKNTFSLRDIDRERLKRMEVDVYDFLRPRLRIAFLFRRLRWLGYPQDFMIKECKRVLQPRMAEAGIQQIGVKEIDHQGWQYYARHFPNMRVLVTGRDPRDVYISAYRKWRLGSTSWQGPFTPERVAQKLNIQFSRQRAMEARTDCLRVRYEKLCTDPSFVHEIMDFTESPIPEMGKIGQFTAAHPKRKHEHDRHGNRITELSVNRWKREKDERLLDRAFRMFDLMPEYVEFWEYSR